MADCGDTSLGELQCVLVVTNLDTNIGILVRNNETVFHVKEKICKEHQLCYPEFGEILISALKIKRRGDFFRFSDNMFLSKAFVGFNGAWYIYVDAVRVEKNEPMTIVAVDQNCSEPELLAEKKTAIESVLVDEHTKDMTYKEGLEIDVPKKTTKKRKMKSLDLDAERVEKDEPMTIVAVDQNRSDPELLEKKETAIESVLVDEHTKDMTFKEVLETDVPKKTTKKRKMKSSDRKGSRKKVHVDAVTVEKNEPMTIMAVDQHRSDPELLEKKETAIESVLVDEHTKDMSFKEVLETDVPKKTTKKRKMKSLDDEGSKKNPSVDLNQTAASKYVVDKNHDVCGKAQVEAVASESEKKTSVSMEENQKTLVLDRLLQEKNLTIASDLVDVHIRGDVNDVQANQNLEEARETELALKKSNGSNESNKSCVTVPAESLKQDLERGEKTAEIVKIDVEKNLAPSLELLDGHIMETEGVNESREVCGEVQVGVAAEHCGILPREKLDELLPGTVEKDNKGDEESRLAPNAADNLRPAELVKPDNQLEAISGPTTEKKKKKKRKKSTKDHGKTVEATTGPATKKKKEKRTMPSKDLVDQSTAATTTSKEIVNDSIDRVDATFESVPVSRGEMPADSLADAIQNENEVGEKVVDKVGSGEATLIGAVKIQAANSLQVSDLAITPPFLVEESKTLDQIGKLTEKNKALEHDTVKDNVDEAKPVKSTKKKTSKKAKISGKEDILAAFGAQNVELVLGKEPDDVIRNVLDCLQDKNGTQENLNKTEKKSRKQSKKKHASDRFSGSLQDILGSSSSYIKAELAASQSQSQDVFEDESPALDFVPDSQAN